MSQRGRGTLEINPSRNPFFHTTSSDIGAKIHERSQMEWDRPSSNSSRRIFDEQSPQHLQQEQQQQEPNAANNYGEDFSFLYARSSDTIGSKVSQRSSNNLLGQCMDTKPLIHKKRLQDTGSNVLSEQRQQPLGREKKNVESILQSYHHVPKEENPLYTTSMNDYGKKLPSVATFVAERAYRPQDFSKSFNGIKPKNSSLNTSVTKSTIHPKLDPQFI
jgi:hypothetical protein